MCVKNIIRLCYAKLQEIIGDISVKPLNEIQLMIRHPDEEIMCNKQSGCGCCMQTHHHNGF